MSALKAALKTKLEADATLVALLGTPAEGHTAAVYDSRAPEGAAAPYVIFQKFDGEDKHTLGALSHVEEKFMVKGVCESPADSVDGKPAEDIHDRLGVVLGFDPTLTITGKTQLYTRRKRHLPDYEETKADRVYTHRGAYYEIWTA